MNLFHSSRSNATACGILNSTKEETVWVQATIVLDSNLEQAVDNREAQEVRRP